MGVDYDAVLVVGKEFEGADDAVQFLRDNGLLSEVSEGQINDDGLEEYLPDGMDGGHLNCYTGYGFYIGYGLSCRCPESFQKDFSDGVEMWEKLFPSSPAEIVHTVCVS